MPRDVGFVRQHQRRPYRCRPQGPGGRVKLQVGAASWLDAGAITTDGAGNLQLNSLAAISAGPIPVDSYQQVTIGAGTPYQVSTALGRVVIGDAAQLGNSTGVVIIDAQNQIIAAGLLILQNCPAADPHVIGDGLFPRRLASHLRRLITAPAPADQVPTDPHSHTPRCRASGARHSAKRWAPADSSPAIATDCAPV